MAKQIQAGGGTLTPVLRSGARSAHYGARLDRVAWAGALVGTAITAVALRVWIYRSPLGVPDSDEAIVGLMTRHILHGGVTTFFWGQSYGGSQEALLTAPVFGLFGSSWLALRIVPILLSIPTALVIRQVGRRTVHEPAATTAAALSFVWPAFLLYKTTHQWGFYASAVLYSALLLWLALRLVERPGSGRAALLGLTIGLALWDDIQLIPVVTGVTVWICVRCRRELQRLWIVPVLAVVGAAPALAWNLQHDFASLHSAVADTTSYQHRLRVFASPLLPMLIGLRTPFSQQPLLSSVVADGLLLVLVAAFAYGAWRSRRTSTSLLYAVLLIFPFVYALAPQTLYTAEPKYLLTLAPALTLLVAQLATTRARGAVLLALGAALSLASLRGMEHWVETTPPNPPIAPADITPLVDLLHRDGIDRVYAMYWAAYRIDFDTKERIIATDSKLTHIRFVDGIARPAHNPFIRWEPYEREVDRASRPAYVFFDWAADRKRGKRRAVRHQLELHGYRRSTYADLIVYVP